MSLLKSSIGIYQINIMPHLFMALLKSSIRIYQINIMPYKSIYMCYEIFHMNIPKKKDFLWLLFVQ